MELLDNCPACNDGRIKEDKQRCIRVCEKCGLELDDKFSSIISMIQRSGKALNLSMLTQKSAVKIMISGKNIGLPVDIISAEDIAATTIYMAAIRTGERRTQADIAREVKTTPVAIHNGFKIFYKLLERQIESL